MLRRPTPTTRTLRAGAVALLATAALTAVVAAAAGTWWLAAGPVVRVGCALPGGTACGAPTVEDAVLGGCGLALLACLAWMLVAVTVAAASFVAAQRSPGGQVATQLARVAETTCPAAVRRTVAVVLGAVLSAGAGAAHAAPAPSPSPPASPAQVQPLRGSWQGRLDGLALPDRVTGAGIRSVAPVVVLRARPAGDRPDPDHVTVRPGDSLWSIAAGLLGPHATDAQVSSAWHRLAERNAGRLGPDPDLILPGTRLTVPDLRPPA